MGLRELDFFYTRAWIPQVHKHGAPNLRKAGKVVTRAPAGKIVVRVLIGNHNPNRPSHVTFLIH